MVASFELILFGPICVDCEYNFAKDSAGFDSPNTHVLICLFVLTDAGTSQTPCLTAFSRNPESYRWEVVSPRFTANNGRIVLAVQRSATGGILSTC